MSARGQLRDETRAEHDQLDALMSAHDLGTPDGYRRFLLAQAAAFLPVEAALTAAGAAQVLPDWSTHSRSDALRADLAALGIAVPDAVPAPGFDGTAALAGGIYVLEGSRLGALTLRPQVAPGLPDTFLSMTQPQGRWATIVSRLEQILDDVVKRHEAVVAARATFACFVRAAGGEQAR